MERTGKLADLKLVNKYYPPVSNYSYPRTEIGTRHERPVGRSSVGSDCSAPGMTDDQESDISVEDANQYHLAGDELWDTFWEDAESFCGTKQVEDKVHGAVVSRSARYPALIPSPVAQRKAHRGLPWDDRRAGPQVQKQDGADQDAAIRCWPLAAAERPVTPGSKPVKASYSLFPQSKPTPVLNLTPRRPARPPRSGFLWETQPHDPSTVSQTTSSLGRSTRPKKLHLPTSDGAISYNSTSHTHSAPVSPTMPSPLQSAATILRRSEPNSLAQPRQMILTRICSDTTDLYSMATNTASQETLTAPTIPPRSPQRKQGRHSRQHSQLRNSITAEDLDAEPAQEAQKPPITGTGPVQPSSSSPQETSQWPTLPPPPPPSPQRPPPPPPAPPQQQHRQQPEPDLPAPVSFFELDSDSEDEDVNFARRIVRNLTPHKRTRSATATSRSRKGSDLAREQLRRARAGTVTTTTTPPPLSTSGRSSIAAGRPSTASGRTSLGVEERVGDGVAASMAAGAGARGSKQRGEVLGRLFGGRWS
ncbi:hypothetical protein SLS53_007816 [Cytospora paraplurivora]|uniref:Uncharacterized protein n=1 Tax=Cytospora paraplurivora TaxID=2898453 RepID=A0AAN9U7A1_9PEZI